MGRLAETGTERARNAALHKAYRQACRARSRLQPPTTRGLPLQQPWLFRGGLTLQAAGMRLGGPTLPAGRVAAPSATAVWQAAAASAAATAVGASVAASRSLQGLCSLLWSPPGICTHTYTRWGGAGRGRKWWVVTSCTPTSGASADPQPSVHPQHATRHTARPADRKLPALQLPVAVLTCC